jgi:hypothetical protein
MAEVKFKGFVEKLLGTKGVKVSERHAKKNDAGEWETVGRTFFTVWVGDNAQPEVGSQIEVTGLQKTVASEYNGEKRYDLTVSASVITVLRPATERAADAWATKPVQDAPF